MSSVEECLPGAEQEARGLRGRRVLVTGGAGAIGSRLVAGLVRAGCHPVVVDDLSSGHHHLVPEGARLEQGSILDRDCLARAFADGIDHVFHLASLFANQNSVDHPERDLNVNGLGTLRVLEKAREAAVERFVFASSSCVYGNCRGLVSEDRPRFYPDTPYAITKLLGERYVDYFRDRYGLATVTLRLFNVYGPGELPGRYRNVVPNFLARAWHGEPLPIFGSGEETRDFNWVGDVVRMFLLAATHPRAVGETFNVGSGVETRIIDLATMINRIANNGAGVSKRPRRDWDQVLRRCADIGKARRLLGYAPSAPALEERLRATFEWLRSNHFEASSAQSS